MEEFSDLLDEIKRQGGPLLWVTQKKQFIENLKQSQKRSPEQLKRDVLNSDRLRHVIDKLLLKPQVTRDEIETEAKKILDEMSHDFDLKYVRFLGYILIKVFSNIHEHIYYNNDILDNLAVVKHYPTLLLPLHRSYMDFLLVSIVCYHKNVQLPAVAAGQDFLSMSFVSKAIRHCGAFFIRRSFGSDELYWAVFHEYVQQHLQNCDRPIEFFIEGTRSRTSKSLQPKQGMLSTCVELFMRGHRCQDIYFIPISLTYERLLEEILYSNELLGIPKPKESVSGLVKARAILKENYGSIFINFARPISLREALAMFRPSPTVSLLNPSFIFELSKDQFGQIESLSYLILITMSRNQVIQPISLISTCFLAKNRGGYNKVFGVDFKQLCTETSLLKQLLINLGVKVYWPEKDVEKLVRLNLGLHSNLFVEKDGMIFNRIETDKIFSNASLYIATCSYKNQLVNFLVRISFVLSSVCLSNFDRVLGFEVYKFMTKVYSKEFIFRSGDELKDFDDSLKFLINTNLMTERDQTLEINKFNLNKFIFIFVLFEKLFKNYEKIYQVMVELGSTVEDKILVKKIQDRIFDEMKHGVKGVLFDYEVLSLNLIGNAVSVLKSLGVCEGKVINTDRLVYLKDKLVFMNRVIELKVKELIEASKEFDEKIGMEHKNDFVIMRSEQVDDEQVNLNLFSKFFNSDLRSKI